MAITSASLRDETYNPAGSSEVGSDQSRGLKILSLLIDRPVIMLGLYLMVGMALTFYVSWQHKIELEHSSAIRAATAYSEAITSIRGFYSRQIFPRAVEAGAAVSHEYRDMKGTVPFPATMSIDLGLSLTQQGEGTVYRIYSDYPFPWRAERTIDAFEKQAMARLIADPKTPVTRFDRTDNGKVLRYATAVVMGKGCISCHNALKDSPRTDWRIGDVRGVQQVTVRLPDNRNFAFMEMALTAFIAGLALLLMWAMTTRLQNSLRLTRDLAAISDRRNSELVVAKGEAEKANAAKTRFLATMSHELRTPLNSIIGFSDVLKNADKNPQIRDSVVEYATDIQTSGTHLLDLINEILDMSKIEAGMFEIEEETISLQETIDTCVRLLSQRAETESVTLDNKAPDTLPPLLGDRKAMRQILLNLLSNAVKFTEAGGRVTIDGGKNEKGVWLTVADTGVGIPDAQIGEIFKPFTQADNSTARHHEGTGLGLPITKALVELHGGRLTLDSTVDVGTTVTVQLPASQII